MLYKSLATLSTGQDKEDNLGAWFMWPEGGHERPRELPQDSTLVVYFHGNSQDRGFGHRVRWRFQTSPNNNFLAAWQFTICPLISLMIIMREPYFLKGVPLRDAAWSRSPRACSRLSLFWRLVPGPSHWAGVFMSGYIAIDSYERKSIKFVVPPPPKTTIWATQSGHPCLLHNYLSMLEFMTNKWQ